MLPLTERLEEVCFPGEACEHRLLELFQEAAAKLRKKLSTPSSEHSKDVLHVVMYDGDEPCQPPALLFEIVVNEIVRHLSGNANGTLLLCQFQSLIMSKRLRGS